MKCALYQNITNLNTVFVQGLLKVAIDNARAQEKQVQLEKTELKMDFLRERELRETLEKQLAMEQKNRGISEIPMKFNTITKMVNIIIYVMVSYLL
jgi:hypothetical protein